MTTGASLLVTLLEQQGVDVVFGLPGTQNVELFEALRRSRIRTIVATHELAAGFMANGYARSTGRAGTIVAIQGPGFTYTLTALAEALHDSAPVVLLTGTPDATRGFALQALDQAAIAGPMVKTVLRVSRADLLGPEVARAYALALEGEPGPVVLELPPLGDEVEARGIREPPSPAPLAAAPDQLLALLHTSRRPVIYAGQGCAAAAPALRRLVENLGSPVATTLSGRGVLPEDHPLALGIDLSPAGVAALNRLFDRADLILALGCKLSHNGSAGFQLKLPPERLVHVDASAKVLGVNYPARLLIQTDLTPLLHRLAADSLSPSEWSGEELRGYRTAARNSGEGEPTISGVEPATPEGFFRALRTALPRDAILALDSGLHQMLARRHYPVWSPRGLLAPSDFQSMGFGLPAAIGAAVGAPDRPVVALIGDGGFGMSGLELLTVVRERIPVATIVFNDGALGLIRQQQFREFGYAHGTELQPVDLAAFAAAIDLPYALLDSGDPVATLRAAVGQPFLIEVVVGDSPALRRTRVTGRAKALARSALGPRLIRLLKSWLR